MQMRNEGVFEEFTFLCIIRTYGEIEPLAALRGPYLLARGEFQACLAVYVYARMLTFSTKRVLYTRKCLEEICSVYF